MNEIHKKLFEWMLFSRYFENLAEEYWDRRFIPGEMHLGIGEEAICAGIIAHLLSGDSLALDHRGTPPILMRDVDPLSVMLEFMGHEEGLCKGMGGHIHLFSKDELLGTSGIVGASGPLSLGFALASTFLRERKIAVSFFGEGAFNQGMLMESFNLAVAWNLPVLFVCKDNGWAITTRSEHVTGGDLLARAKAFGLNAIDVNGSELMDVYNKSQTLIRWIREGNGPGFIHASCVHPKGHFLGDSLVRASDSIKGLVESSRDLISGATSLKGGSINERWKAMKSVFETMSDSKKDLKFDDMDPFEVFRTNYAEYSGEIESIDLEVRKRIEQLKTVVEAKIKEGKGRSHQNGSMKSQGRQNFYVKDPILP